MPYFPRDSSMIALSVRGTRCLFLQVVSISFTKWIGEDLHLAIASLIDQLTNGLKVWITVGDIRFNNAKHLDGSFSETDENAIVDLKKTKKLKSLALLWINLVDTLDTNHKGKLWFSRDVEGSIRLGNSSKANLLTFRITILLDVLLSTLEDGFSLLLVCLQRLG